MFIDFSLDGLLDYFQLSAIVEKKAAIIILIHVFGGTFDLILVVQIRENEIGELKNRYTFSFIKNYQTVLQSGYTILH